MQAAAADLGSLHAIADLNNQGPLNGLVEAAPGVFYSNGGESHQAIFEVTATGTVSRVADLPPGQYIQAPLVGGANGLFYSSAAHRLDPVSLFSIGHAPGSLRFYPPHNLDPMLTENLADGSLLGIAATLSANPVYSLVKCGLDGGVTSLHEFAAGERLPRTAIYARDGRYYGLAYLPDGSGYVYAFTSSGKLTKLASLPPGSLKGNPVDVPLVEGQDGNFFGSTNSGGASHTGTIYKLTPSGHFATLHSFAADRNSFSPTTLIEASDGNLYGTTLGVESQFFRITKSGAFTLLSTMVMVKDGRCPCQLIQASDGAIYGTASLGGTTGLGTVFVWHGDLPKPRPRVLSFQPESAAPGAEVLIWGAHLLGASVSFNDLPAAKVSAIGPNYVRATIPSGAATGPITVTTSGGRARSLASLKIIR